MMPSDMRLQCPSEDTPPSTRPPSVASSAASSSTPRRSTSMDSLNTNSSSSEKPTGEEFIPTRLIRATPKANSNAMQFVKTGPALLHKTAKEMMKKAEVVKSLRKTSLQEEEEWQSQQSSPSSTVDRPLEEGSDWQSNLDKWKSSRRKRNEDVLERVIEVKKNEQDDEFSKTRRKSKTFSEMREEKTKRGRRYNLVVHDDDNNDLSDLGLNPANNGTSSSLSDPPEEGEAKSDAGFCTGSDTGSDGVFAEDNISDTSSALGDKREIHDSLLDSGNSSVQKDSEIMLNGHFASTSMKSVANNDGEYTYDKAIEDYKQFAENSAKKRTSSVTSLSSNASGSKDDHERITTASSATKKLDEKLSFYDSGPKESKVIRRERNTAKIDIDKRRSMFELRDIDGHNSKQMDRRSMEVIGSLRSKVASFENINESDSKAKGVTPLRDSKFKEKLASFSEIEKGDSRLSSPKRTPERDQNFHKKLHSFAQIERSSTGGGGGGSLSSIPRRASEIRHSSWKTTIEKKEPTRLSSGLYDRRGSTPAPMPLKDRIASFENLSPRGSSPSKRELSVSMENLNKGITSSDSSRSMLHSSQSVTNLFRRTPSSPFVVVEVDEEVEEKMNGRTVSRDPETQSLKGAKIDTSKDKAPLYGPSSTKSRIPLLPASPPPKLPEKSRTSEYSTLRATVELSTSRTLPEIPKPKGQPDLLRSRKLPEVPTARIVSPANSLTAIPRTLSQEYLSKSPISEKEFEEPKTLPEECQPTAPICSSKRLPEISPTKTPGISFSQSPKEPPPPIPPPRAPTIEDPHRSPAELYYEKFGEEVDDVEYGDQDIDEVIGNYESLTEPSRSVETLENAVSSICHTRTTVTETSFRQENVYEKISEKEPVYENIYEKVGEELETSSVTLIDDANSSSEYQTVDEVVTTPPLPPPKTKFSPPLPPKNKNLTVFEVLDVTWTEDNISSRPLAAPPSVPPPPPPPEESEEGEEDLEEESEGLGRGSPSTITPSSIPVEKKGPVTKPILSSPQSTKNELRKMMSDFLGTKPLIEEAVILKPPPDANELLRQEREDERLIVQKQANMVRESPSAELEFLVDTQYPAGRPKYTWEDRMKADGPKKDHGDLDESSDHLEFQTPTSNTSSSPSKHALNTYQNYVNSFTLSTFLVENTHNNSKWETLVASEEPRERDFLSKDNRNLMERESEVSETQNHKRTYVPQTPKSVSGLHKNDYGTPAIASLTRIPQLLRKEAVDEGYRNASSLTRERAKDDSYYDENYGRPFQYVFLDPKDQPGHFRRTGQTSSAELNEVAKFLRATSENNAVKEPNLPLGHTRDLSRSFESLKSNVDTSQRSLLYRLPKSELEPKQRKITKETSEIKSSNWATGYDDSVKLDDASSDIRFKNFRPPKLAEARRFGGNKNLSKSVGALNENIDKPQRTYSPVGWTQSKPGSVYRRSLSRSESCLSELPDVPTELPRILRYSNPSIDTRATTHFPNVPSTLPDGFSNGRPNSPISNITSALLDTISDLLDDEYHRTRMPNTKVLSLPPRHLASSAPCTNPSPTAPYDTLPLHAKTEGVAHLMPRSFQELKSRFSRQEDHADHRRKKLAELEQEMEKHDREMLQRVKGPSMPEEQQQQPVPLASYQNSPPPDIPPAAPRLVKDHHHIHKPPPSIPANDCSTSKQGQEATPSYIPNAKSTPIQPPTNQEFYLASIDNKYEESTFKTHLSTQETLFRGSNERICETKVVDSEETFNEEYQGQQGPPLAPRKQSILALSAIPKPRLTDNDSWIMKRKAESGKKDYSKHWLIQEAEQRRLEQQDRISRPSQIPLGKPADSSSFASTPSYQNHFQSIKSSFHSPPLVPSPNASPNIPPTLLPGKPSNAPFCNGSTNGGSFSQAQNESSSKYIYNSSSCSSSSSNTFNSSSSNWMKQTKTYQPPQPSPPSNNGKPLPDAIINTITQRVNNKNKINGSATRPSVYTSNVNGNYRNDENYHDYMNTDTFNSVPNKTSPVGRSTAVPQGQLSSGPMPVGNNSQVQISEDQRLLSVSGKKKCSHCGEELGRGAAMIIESLRLFYHIPCFKCCVCGTQLGNGTSGADVRVRNHKLHCHNCYSNDEGMKFSKV